MKNKCFIAMKTMIVMLAGVLLTGCIGPEVQLPNGETLSAVEVVQRFDNYEAQINELRIENEKLKSIIEDPINEARAKDVERLKNMLAPGQPAPK